MNLKRVYRLYTEEGLSVRTKKRCRAYRRGVQLEFIRPGRPVENAFIESFNGCLRDECLNDELFFSIEDARRKLEAWRINYNTNRPHSSLGDMSPREYARGQQPEAAIHPTLNLGVV